MDFTVKDHYDLQDLLAIVRLLRDPAEGCPWDKVQTHQSIRRNFIEETYEVCDAIDQNDVAGLREELGDVLLQVALHTQMEQEQGHFDFGDVADDICQKLVLRHPHIFGSAKAGDGSQALDNWEAIKKQSKGVTSAAQHAAAVPHCLPALMRAKKVQKRLAEEDGALKDRGQAISSLKNAVDCLDKDLQNCDNREELIGDALYALVSVARLAGADAEEVLGFTCDRAISRHAQRQQK